MKKLIDEPPLLLLPTLAELIGESEAIIFQQVHYWLGISKHEIQSRKWIYNTYADWQKQFPFWSKNKIIRTIKSLEDKGLLITDNFNKRKGDKTKWYTINYDELEKIISDYPKWVKRYQRLLQRK